jgi:ribosomal protein L28
VKSQEKDLRWGIMFLTRTIRLSADSFPNLQKKRFFIPEEDRWITLKVSTKAIKTINKHGISAVLKEAKAKGFFA